MTVTTIYSDAADGNLQSRDAAGNYAAARAGTGDVGVSAFGNQIMAGQLLSGSMYVIEGHVSFDTSVIPDGDLIASASMTLVSKADNSTADFTIEARVSDWGATLEAADWVAGASLASLPRVATYPTASGWTVDSQYTFTEDGTNFRTNLNKTGTTFLILCSDKTVAGTAPASSEYVTAYSSEELGTTKDPVLTITHGPVGKGRRRRVPRKWAGGLFRWW